MDNFNKEDLKNKLTELEYNVTQNKGTEQAFTGKYYNHKENGNYLCIVCNSVLFTSDKKYDSGSGWPSFYEALDKDKIKEITDHSHGMTRVEVQCKNCSSHLGHVFNDGPGPSNLRYCINSCSLNFKKK